jgi:hypothetical protein
VSLSMFFSFCRVLRSTPGSYHIHPLSQR